MINTEKLEFATKSSLDHQEEKIFANRYRRISRNDSDEHVHSGLDHFKEYEAGNKSNVLFVGFTSNVASSLAREFEDSGWYTFQAIESISAIALLRESAFNLVVLSIEGVDKYGPKLVAEMRNVTPSRTRTCIIGVCDLIEDELINQLMRSGINTIWSLPISKLNKL
ncbi:MAG: hypothetical protein ABJ261_13300 [Lentilitoribacter sp.]